MDYLLNKNGTTLLSYRNYFMRAPAGSSVRRAIQTEVTALYSRHMIPEDIFRMLCDDSIPDEEFYKALSGNPRFQKTTVELDTAFDAKRAQVNAYLLKIGMTNVSTKNRIVQNKIEVLHTYDISKDLLIRYFGLSPAELEPLMGRKGFMDKFCVLRLNKVFLEIRASLGKVENIDHRYTLVYYNPDINGFSIDYEYLIDINLLKSQDGMMTTLDRVKTLDAQVTDYFNQMVTPTYFKQHAIIPASVTEQELAEIQVPERAGRQTKVPVKSVQFDMSDDDDEDEEEADTAPAPVTPPAAPTPSASAAPHVSEQTVDGEEDDEPAASPKKAPQFQSPDAETGALKPAAAAARTAKPKR